MGSSPHKVIERELKISRNTITAWQQHFKLVAVKALQRNNYVLGGRNVVVEIDESMFIKGKDSRPQVWVFGLYDRD